MRKLAFFLSILLTVSAVYAQQFPVQVTSQLIPPYTTQISDYFSPSEANAKLNLLLLNRDFNKPVLNVRLRMSVESQGIRLRTRESTNFPVISIGAGVPYYVKPYELAQYFNINNLEISGMSPQEYNTIGKLPEGFYTFCFEVVEVSSGQTVSNKGCTFAWMNLNDPPMLNLPVKGESVVPSESPAQQNVYFAWTPRSTASPVASYTTIYIFTLSEIIDSTISPEAAFLSTTPLAIDSTTQTFLQYNSTMQALVPGKKYAWRVQAKTKDGISEVATFKNNGYSEIFWFNYKTTCPLVTNVGSAVLGKRATISWLDNPQHLDYKVIYRETNNSKAEWFSTIVSGTQTNLSDLKSSTEYQYRVGASCEQGVYTFSPTYTFTTLDSTKTSVPDCGTDPNLIAAGNTTSLANLVQGDTINAGDFTVRVTKVTAATSPFAGEGYVIVSYLAGMKLAVTFTNIQINTDRKLVGGTIQTTYDPTEGGIESVDDYIDYFTAGYGVGGVVTGAVKADTTFNVSIGNASNIHANLPTNYNTTTGTVTGGGTIPIVITPASGEPQINYNVEKLPVTIMDKDGSLYQVDKNGTVTKIGTAGGDKLISTITPALIDDDKALVKFIPHPTATFAFDEWKPVYKNSTVFNKEYERIRTATNDDYYVSAKAIAPAVTDFIKAKITLVDNTINPDSVKFVSGKGIIYSATVNKSAPDTTYEISIMGGPEKDAQEIYAVYQQAGKKTLNLGKLLVASYPRKEYNVKIIPVNGHQLSNLSSIEAEVNSTFNKLNVNISVTSLGSFNNSTWDSDGDGLDVKGSSAFSLYTPEMSALIKEYKKHNPVDAGTFYVFVLDKAADSTVLGDMPRGKQFGFLFTDGNTNQGRVLAHEIGHGIFKLKHVFEYEEKLRDSLVGNLLNYPAGNNLSKMQWDLVHDPASLILSFFEGDGDGLYSSVDSSGLPSQFKNPGSESYSFYGPTGKIYTLPSDIKSVQFSTGDLYFVEDNPGYIVHPEQIAMVGSLVSFVDKEGVKWYHTTSNTWPTITNLDFQKADGTKYVENPAFASITKRPVIGRPCFKEGKPVLQLVNVLNTSDINIINGFTWAQVPALNKYYLDNILRCEYTRLNMPDVGTAVNYIYANSKEASYDKEYATYIFALADLINVMPEIQLCVYASDDGFEEYEKALSEINDPAEKSDLLREYYNKYFKLYFEFFKTKNKNPEFYFNQQCAAISIEALCKATRVNSLSEFSCLIETVSWTTRKQLLELFSDYNNILATDQKSRTRNAIGILIQNTPKDQESSLLTFLANDNYLQLFKIYDNLDEYNAEIIINKLVPIINQNYASNRDLVAQQMVEPETLSASDRLNSYNIPIWKTNSLLDCSSWLNSLLNGPISSIPVASICEGFSTKRYQADNMLVHLYKLLDGTLYVSRTTETDPFFGFVNLHFKDAFNYANIKEGTKITVPGIYAYHFAKRNQANLNAQATRIAINTAAILGAVFSGGSSLSLLGVTSITLSVGDIVVAIKEDELLGTPAGREFIDYYNKFTIALTVVQGVAAIPGTGKLITRFTPNKFQSVSRQLYKEVLDKATDLIASAQRGKDIIMRTEQFLKFRNLVTAQMLRIKIAAECRAFNTNSFYPSFENLYLKTGRLNNGAYIAEYRFLDDAQVLDFSKGRTVLVEDRALADEILDSSDYEKVGAIDNTSYLKKDGTYTKSDLDIYQNKVSPDKFVIIERVNVGVNTAGDILEKYKVAIFDKVKILTKDEALPQFIKESFLDNYYYTAETLEKVGVFRRFGGGPSQAKLFGGFSSTEAVVSRSELAILKKWSTMQFEAELLIEKGVKLNLGKIAPQSIYSGGADQVLLPLGYPENWVKSIKDLKTGTVYNLEDFKIAFPDQIK